MPFWFVKVVNGGEKKNGLLRSLIEVKSKIMQLLSRGLCQPLFPRTPFINVVVTGCCLNVSNPVDGFISDKVFLFIFLVLSV